jgi:hypothetical protein
MSVSPCTFENFSHSASRRIIAFFEAKLALEQPGFMVNVQAWMKLSGPLLILTGQYQEREIGSTELFHQTFGGGDTGNRSAVEFDR